MRKDMKIAVLIDAENISSKYADTILKEASGLGNVIYKRIYGNWTSSQLGSWKQELLDHAIQPIQQYSNTAGKNSSDSALIIDAMDLLYQNRLDAFCIVSSDSDFTRLASRLRESEMYVLGMGEQKTPRAFISACNKFVYLDVIEKQKAKRKAAKNQQRIKNNEHAANRSSVTHHQEVKQDTDARIKANQSVSTHRNKDLAIGISRNDSLPNALRNPSAQEQDKHNSPSQSAPTEASSTTANTPFLAARSNVAAAPFNSSTVDDKTSFSEKAASASSSTSSAPSATTELSKVTSTHDANDNPDQLPEKSEHPKLNDSTSSSAENKRESDLFSSSSSSSRTSDTSTHIQRMEESTRARAAILERANHAASKDDEQNDPYSEGTDIIEVTDALMQITEDYSDDEGWIPAANLANLLSRRISDFDTRNFGFKKFVPFIESLKTFEKRSITSKEDPSVSTIYFRLIED